MFEHSVLRHRFYIELEIFNSAGIIPSHGPLARIGLRDYTQAMDRFCMPGDTAAGRSCAHGTV
jgi:hypothetical protein